MRQLATIQLVADVQPIENADAIEKIRVRDWWCVAKKEEFAVGDPCVYFEIDSLLPSSNPAFAFLAKGRRESSVLLEGGGTAFGYRLRTIRLRGQISQGLALPVGVFGLAGIEVGTDVSETLGIVKWEPPVPKQMAAAARGPFPSFIPKTDEERVQNLGDTVAAHAGEAFWVTEKLDGCSVTFYRTEDRFGVCSRNWGLLDGNLYWNAARKYQLEEKLPVGYAIQGEIIGEAIQANPLKRKGQELYAFNVYDIRGRRYLAHAEMAAFCGRISLPVVPVVAGPGYQLPSGVAEIVQMADGKSLLTPDCDREGLVLRPVVEQMAEIGGQWARLSFKAISNSYLLQEK